MNKDDPMDRSETPEFHPRHSWLGAAEEAVVSDAEETYASMTRHEQGSWASIESLIRIAFIRGVNTQKYGPASVLDEQGNWKADAR